VIYTYKCPACRTIREEIQGVNDHHSLKCPVCGIDMDRDWQADLPSIQGDTCAGGCNYMGYDETLGVELRGRTHRNQVMKEKGFREYTPDPKMKAYRDEIGYVQKHAQHSDRKARRAVQQLGKEAGRSRRQAILDKSTGEITKTVEKVLAAKMSE